MKDQKYDYFYDIERCILMNGQMKKFKERQAIAEDFIKNTNPYVNTSFLNVDFRKYAQYVKSKGLRMEDIDVNTVRMFEKINTFVYR